MEVTRVNMRKTVNSGSGICAEAEIIIDDSLCIKKIHVIRGEQGIFVAFPNTGDTKMVNGKKRVVDLVHPITQELREKITKAVLAQYNE